MAESTNEFSVEDALSFLEATAPFIMSKDMTPHVYSNDTTNPVPYGLLDIVYRTAHENRLGIMHAKHDPTGEIRTVLCFVGDRDGENVELYPIAVLLQESDVADYLSPIGNGEYFERAAE